MGWLWLHCHSQGTLLLRRMCSACCTDSPEKGGHSSSALAVRDLKNLYCCDIPDSMMNRELLLSHFGQFGHVVRIYLSVKRKSCTVHFDSHVSMFVCGSRFWENRIFWDWSICFYAFVCIYIWQCKYKTENINLHFSGIAGSNFNPLKTKCRPLYLKTHSVPRCKHFSSRL